MSFRNNTIAFFNEDSRDKLSLVAQKIFLKYNWNTVRSIGELKIVTKVSYIVLILVPILVTTWPTVRGIINAHNESVKQAAKTIESVLEVNENAISEINRSISKGLEGNNEKYAIQVSSHLQDLSVKINKITPILNEVVDDFAERSIRESHFPWALMAAFFSSLSIVLGHLVYQVFAPEKIKNYTLDEYVNMKLSSEGSDDKPNFLNRAKYFLTTDIGRIFLQDDSLYLKYKMKELAGLDESERFRLIKSLPEYELVSLTDWHSTLDDEKKIEYAEVNKILATSIENNAIKKTEVSARSLLKTASRIEYLTVGAGGKLPMTLCFALYTVGILLVLEIVYTQSVKVLSAAMVTGLDDFLFGL